MSMLLKITLLHQRMNPKPVNPKHQSSNHPHKAILNPNTNRHPKPLNIMDYFLQPLLMAYLLLQQTGRVRPNLVVTKPK